MEIGERIRKLRKEKGLTLKQLSEQACISLSFLSDIENGRSQPSLERVRSLAAVFGIPVSFLMGETETVPFQTASLQGNGLEIAALAENPAFKLLWTEIRDFGEWSEEDRQELLAYLKAKRLSRMGQRK